MAPGSLQRPDLASHRGRTVVRRGLWHMKPKAPFDTPLLGRFNFRRPCLQRRSAMNIGAATRRSGLSANTLRYYEEIGLSVRSRRANACRDYAPSNVHKLAFLKRARGLGFLVGHCRALLSLYEEKLDKR